MESYNTNKIALSRAFKWAIANAIIMIAAYAITWRYYAMWWFIILFLDLMAIAICIAFIISSLVFWIKNQKLSNQSYGPFLINMGAVVLLILAPSIYRNKNYYNSTFELNNCEQKNKRPLYIETYCVYGGGALSTDMNSLYLTDSLNFRKYIGTYDEGEERIFTRCNGDLIIVEKIKNINSSPDGTWPNLPDRKTYSLKYLKTQYGND